MPSGPVEVSSLGRAALHYHPLQNDSAAPMAPLPPIVQPDPTLEAIDRAIEARARREARRTYLGISSIGHPCGRKLWYGLHTENREVFDAETLYRFEDGHRGEDLMAERLRMVAGITLMTIDPDTGRQFRFEDHAGQFAGHPDGVILGLLQAPKTYHLWEHKQVGEKKQAELVKLKAKHGEKSALRHWNIVYYGQAICYLHYAQLDRHYLTCSTPGGRKTVSVRTDADPVHALGLIDKAKRIIEARAPLARLSNDPSWHECRFCGHHSICHGVA